MKKHIENIFAILIVFVIACVIAFPIISGFRTTEARGYCSALGYDNGQYVNLFQPFLVRCIEYTEFDMSKDLDDQSQ
jgi:hypothetical protein